MRVVELEREQTERPGREARGFMSLLAFGLPRFHNGFGSILKKYQNKHKYCSKTLLAIPRM